MIVSPVENELLLKSATQLAKEIREKKITSKQVIQAYVNRLKEVNPTINCVAENYSEKALKSAEAVDEEIRNANDEQLQKFATEKPLLGVPFTCKDMCEIEGTTTTFGAWKMRNNVSTRTDSMIKLYMDAGAICLAKTVVPEMCMWLGSNNAIHGVTNNPYDSRRNSGGSSSGEGAIIAAAASVIGLGSDIGGSIRIPSTMNGIYGLKTSPGSFPIDGGFGNPAEETFGIFGPMGRYVEDLETIMKCYKDTKARPATDFSVKEILVPSDYSLPWVPRISSEMREANKNVVDFLLQEFNLPSSGTIDFNPARKDFMNNFLAVFNNFAQRNKKPELTMKGLFYMADGPFNTLTELPKWLLGRSHHSLASCFQITQLDRSYTEEQLDMYMKKLDDLRAHYDHLLSTDKVIVQPGWPSVADWHYAEISHLNFAYTGVVNYLGLPSIVCPVGLNDDGLPLAIQIIGPRHSDFHLLEIAKKVHSKFGGWREPGSHEKA
ncbi:unnamed protein product, partial [Mesorhabditis belari]|uniref:Amidase domain-containing protein n=1 Tax=Mesorhabditis belari TaxID=2138241 RepID=A0AAF3EQD4_9BILA